MIYKYSMSCEHATVTFGCQQLTGCYSGIGAVKAALTFDMLVVVHRVVTLIVRREWGPMYNDKTCAAR